MVLPMILLPLVLASCFAETPRFLGPPIKAPPEIPPEPSPEVCGDNEQYVSNSTACQITCANRQFQDTAGGCKPFSGCVCIQGLVRLNDDATGPCVTEDQCPPSCPKGEYYVTDTNLCEKTCDNRHIYNVMGPCQPYSKCVCNDGLMRLCSDPDAPCVNEDQCPPCQSPPCGYNEVWTDNMQPCPPETCISRYILWSCSAIDRIPRPGCQCIDGYLRNASNICVPIAECPPPSSQPDPRCDKNEEWTYDKIPCPPDTCDTLYVHYPCAAPPEDRPPQPGCKCIEGFLRDSNNNCIRREKCPPLTPPTPQCGENEIYSEKKITCPPQSCEAASGLIQYLCAMEEPRPGCNCIDGFLRDANGTCIPRDKCPPGPVLHFVCGKNEVESDNKITCPPQTCESIGRLYKCLVTKPERGCNCIKGYLRNAKGECIPREQCPGKSKCRVSKACKRTCANPVVSADCVSLSPPDTNIDGCECQPGYILENETGKCILENSCPTPSCPPNEYYNKCKVECPLYHYCPVTDIQVQGILTCEPTEPCVPGCSCLPGYMRKSYEDPTCIIAATCPPLNCTRTNEEWNRYPPACLAERCEDATKEPGLCLNASPNYIPRCTCIQGTFRNDSNICVPVNECPGYEQCSANSTYVNCPSPCPPTCAQPQGPAVCAAICRAYGCQCKPGYVSHEGKCIELTDCPQMCTGPNEVWNTTPSPCPLDRCEFVLYPPPCYPDPNPQPRCECKQGYYRNDSNICVPVKECAIKCPANETITYCKGGCPTDYCPVNDNRAIIACSPPYPCRPGCVCQPGYKKKSRDDPRCIKYSDCPPVVCTRPNEEFNLTPPNCIADRCTDYLNPQPCNKPYPNYMPQCVCQKGYYRNSSELCVPASQCGNCSGLNEIWNPSPSPCPVDRCEFVLNPPPCVPNPNPKPRCECKKDYYRNELNKCVPIMECGIKCPGNQTFVWCNVACPTNYCPKSDSRAIIACDPPFPCPHGCACNSGYLRLSETDNKCIKSSECPPVTCTRPNEYWNLTPPDCIRERCEDAIDPQPCDFVYPKPPQCMCQSGYYRNASDICVPLAECPKKCDIAEQCRPTCAVPNPINCPVVPPASTNEDGCQCQKGFILSEVGGTCIRIEDCPQTQSCNGDAHARIMACPWNCPSTCLTPQASSCDGQCMNAGCICESGYIYSENDEKCVPVDSCPGGDPCGPNGTFVDCSFRCPNQYCPQDDSGVVYACKPGRPCPSGCGCKINYLRLSYEDDRCILASECPPVECTMPNEVWNSCTTECLAEQCEDAFKPPAACNTLLLNCIPKCVCQKGTFRDSSGVCVPVKKCPKPECPVNEIFDTCPSACLAEGCASVNNQPTVCNTLVRTVCRARCVCQKNYFRDSNGNCVPANQCPTPPNACTSDCTPTCAVPNPPNCPNPSKVRKPCCEAGQILDVKGGKCIPIENCPSNCSGLNEIWNPSPSPCPVDRCEFVLNPPPCVPNPNPKPRCECKKDYYRNELNKCVPIMECGIKCPGNQTFVWCNVGCPTNYCPKSDSRAIIACDPPFPCPHGCACNSGYLRLSETDNKCIKSSECPPVTCTRPNEYWNLTPPDCIRERCEDAIDPQPCDFVYPKPPQCMCQSGYYRNASDICVPLAECPKKCDIAEQCRPTCAVPNPINCPVVPPASTNEDGCQCQKGFILSEVGGTCIRIEDCPQTQSCNGDPHARIMACPWNCPSTCSSPQASSCDGQCKNAGCICESGYIYSENDGKCVPVDSCPGGDPCGPNGTFVDCSFRCPNQYCPQDDSGVVYACKPGRPCPSGCGCKINYLRLSYEDDRCILASECPPVECTMPNEVWNSCTTECLAEQCEDAFKPPAACNTLLLNCIPKCICQKGTFRDSSGVCVPVKKCPKPKCPVNEIFDTCPSPCLAEGCASVNNQPSVCNTLVRPVCRSRCVCQKNYFRDSNGNCVRANQCPTPPDACTSDCTPTCAVPNPPNCPNPSKVRKPCCEAGQILDVKGGKCIPIENCPKQGCNGDPNAVLRKCPVPCVRSTCAQPEAQLCPTPCSPACECAPGYILENAGGKCIKKEKCSGGAPKCGANSTFVNCKNSCPTAYCPIDDNRATVICETSPFAPCVSGCRCKINYRIKSRKENKCILSAQCPPVKCSRPNEVWNPCPSDCQSEYCEAAFQKPVTCNTLLLNCNPRCVCKKNFFRNGTDICIPKYQCPRFTKPSGKQ